ncbi:glycosyl hydrolase family 28-related protein [Paenibacillus eucommiae]|uniref:Pectate lyase superfamily protein domain-containing protein n=1 Tax=Paenibacillus eucommiae TaxID=1355755 RepID=A0ABS4J723_9BACL|nr:glycosyl hydrolase family 28-related protein [Paenibacillus eucommiae]MBP1994574.1 hypothetical protein [Paenibacillus eucommiae]
MSEDSRISRRKLLASLGVAGAVLATDSLLKGGVLGLAGRTERSAAAAVYGSDQTVTGAVYGSNPVELDIHANLITVSTVADLSTKSIDDAALILVSDPDRGGIFSYSTNVTPIDNGIVFGASDGNRWIRLGGETQPVNVKWFGAKGDGTTNDTAQIQAALNGYAAVYMPASTYLVSGLNVSGGRKIYTDGAATILKQTAGTPIGTRILLVAGSQVSIGLMSYEGNIATDTNEQNHALAIIATTTDLENIEVEGVIARSIRGDALYIGGGYTADTFRPRNISVGLVYSENVYRNGVSITSGENIHIQTCKSIKAGLFGVDIESNANKIIGVTFGSLETSSLGIIGHGTESPATNIKIDNLIIDGSLNNGVIVDYPTNDVLVNSGIVFRNAMNNEFGTVKISNTSRYAIESLKSGTQDGYCDTIVFHSLHIESCALTDSSALGYIVTGAINNFIVHSGSALFASGETTKALLFNCKSQTPLKINNFTLTNGVFGREVWAHIYKCRINVPDANVLTNAKAGSILSGCTIVSCLRLLSYCETCVIEYNDISYTFALYVNNTYSRHYELGNKINGIQNVVVTGVSYPTAGTWLKGDRVNNTNPTIGQPISWTCTTGGTPGVWSPDATAGGETLAAVTAKGGVTTSDVTINAALAADRLMIKEGANKTMGVAALASGTVTINTTAVTVNSRIFVTPGPNGTLNGSVRVSSIIPGVSFKITSTHSLDSADIFWFMVQAY